ncbi:MAG: hypothetical protein M3Z66_16310 [Chloroflexota bacterium]|nr:hypothetical protein [Chloroflexota bacterium]
MVRNLLIWLIIAIFMIAIIFQIVHGTIGQSGTSVPMAGPGSMAALVQGNLAANRPMTLTQSGDTVTLAAHGATYRSTFDPSLNILQFLSSAGVNVRGKRFLTDVTVKYLPQNQTATWITVILGFLPLILFGALLFFMMRSSRRQDGGPRGPWSSP